MYDSVFIEGNSKSSGKRFTTRLNRLLSGLSLTKWGFHIELSELVLSASV